MDWRERVLEDPIANLAPLRDALCLVKPPVDAQLDTALTFFFLSLRQRRKTSDNNRPHYSLVTPLNSSDMNRNAISSVP